MFRTQSAVPEMELFMRYLKNQVIQGTLILTIAGFITRLIGFVYRVYLSDTIGSRLLGVYQLIFALLFMLPVSRQLFRKKLLRSQKILMHL